MRKIPSKKYLNGLNSKALVAVGRKGIYSEIEKRITFAFEKEKMRWYFTIAVITAAIIGIVGIFWLWLTL